MSETLVGAMLRSTTAENFVNTYLVRAFERGKLPNAGKLIEKMAGMPASKLSANVKAVGEGRHDSIVFVDSSYPSKYCGFRVSKLQKRVTMPGGSVYLARVHFFDGPAFFVSVSDFDRAASALGTSTSKRGIQNLLFPKTVFLRKGWRVMEPDPRLANSIRVMLGHNAFENIKNRVVAASKLEKVVGTIHFLSGRMGERTYFDHLDLPPALKQGGLSAYQAFHQMFTAERDAMAKILSGNESKEKTIDLISSNFGVSKKVAGRYHDRIMKACSESSGARAALKLSKDCRVGIANIRA